jgi:hypothetical protein
MPTYRIFRMKEQARVSFRSAPHTSGETAVKLKDYLESESIEAVNAYEAWDSLRNTGQPLEVGDILESELGEIQICKYIGFENAKWIIPEAKPTVEALPVTAGAPTAGSSTGKL